MSTPKTPHDCIRNAEAAIANFATQLSEEALRDIAAVVALAREADCFRFESGAMPHVQQMVQTVCIARTNAALSACGVEVNREG
jgi:hypothetical protein